MRHRLLAAVVASILVAAAGGVAAAAAAAEPPPRDDDMAPGTSPSPSPSPNNGWFNTDVTVTLTIADPRGVLAFDGGSNCYGLPETASTPPVPHRSFSYAYHTDQELTQEDINQYLLDDYMLIDQYNGNRRYGYSCWFDVQPSGFLPFTNFGKPGTTYREMTGRAPALIDPIIQDSPAACYRVLCVQGTLNPFWTGFVGKKPRDQSAHTAVVVWHELRTYVQARKAAGWKVFVQTCSPSGRPQDLDGTTTTVNEEIEEFNGYLINGYTPVGSTGPPVMYAGADGVIDFWADPYIGRQALYPTNGGTAWNPSYWQVQPTPSPSPSTSPSPSVLHYTVLGAEHLGGIICTTLLESGAVSPYATEAVTEYWVDEGEHTTSFGGQWRTMSGLAEPTVTVPAEKDDGSPNDGVHYVHFFSTDMTTVPGRTGNVEEEQVYQVKIDTTPPTTTDNSDGQAHAEFMLVLEPVDATSGVALTEYRVNGGELQTGNTADFTLQTEPNGPGLPAGSYVVTYRSTDVAGNVEAEKTCTVILGK